MAITMPIFCTPLNTKNVFIVLHRSPTSKIYSTTTLHGTHYESQEALLCVLQFFDANGNQRLLMPGMVPKNIVFFLQLKIYAVKNSKINPTYSHTNIRSHSTVDVLKFYFFCIALFRFPWR